MSARFRESRRYPDNKRIAFGNPEANMTAVGKLSEIPKVIYPLSTCFRESRKRVDNRRDGFGKSEGLPTVFKISKNLLVGISHFGFSVHFFHFDLLINGLAILFYRKLI